MSFIKMSTLSRNFAGRLNKLVEAESVVKTELTTLSRDVLAALHEHGNVVFLNRLVGAKTSPMNRKTIVLFFRAFSGFHYDEEKREFTRKNKRVYDEKQAESLSLLSDPDWNIWVWAEASVEPEVKTWSPDKVTKYLNSSLKKAAEAGFDQSAVLTAILQSDIDPAALAATLETLAKEDEEQADAA